MGTKSLWILERCAGAGIYQIEGAHLLEERLSFGKRGDKINKKENNYR